MFVFSRGQTWFYLYSALLWLHIYCQVYSLPLIPPHLLIHQHQMDQFHSFVLTRAMFCSGNEFAQLGETPHFLPPLFLNLHQFLYFGLSLQILVSVLYPHTVHPTKQKLCDYSRLQEPQMKVYGGTYSYSELWAMASSVTKLDFEAKSCWSIWKVWSMLNSLHFFFSSWYCQNTLVASASYSLSWKKGWGSFI